MFIVVFCDVYFLLYSCCIFLLTILTTVIFIVCILHMFRKPSN